LIFKKKSKMFHVEHRVKNMRKMFLLVLSAVLIFGLAACGQKQEQSEKDAYKTGTWIKTMKKAEADGHMHEIRYRITSIDRNEKDVKKKISEYNLSASGNIIEDLSEKDLEYAVAEYEVKFPGDFPQSDFGITDVTLDFTVTGLDGKNLKADGKVYENLDKTWEIGQIPQGYDFSAGDTYKGEIVFVMVKGCSDYLLRESYEKDGKTVYTYVRGK